MVTSKGISIDEIGQAMEHALSEWGYFRCLPSMGGCGFESLRPVLDYAKVTIHCKCGARHVFEKDRYSVSN